MLRTKPVSGLRRGRRLVFFFIKSPNKYLIKNRFKLCLCVRVCVQRSRSDDNNNTRESTKRVELAIGGEGTHECTV